MFTGVVATVLAAGMCTPAHAGGAPVRCNGEVATVVGTNRADVLHGTAGDDVIAALGGRDVVFGLDGDDVVCGGKGRDVLLGNGGVDLLLGNGGRDVAIGGRGHDNCRAEVAPVRGRRRHVVRGRFATGPAGQSRSNRRALSTRPFTRSPTAAHYAPEGSW